MHCASHCPCKTCLREGCSRADRHLAAGPPSGGMTLLSAGGVLMLARMCLDMRRIKSEGLQGDISPQGAQGGNCSPAACLVRCSAGLSPWQTRGGKIRVRSLRPSELICAWLDPQTLKRQTLAKPPNSTLLEGKWAAWLLPSLDGPARSLDRTIELSTLEAPHCLPLAGASTQTLQNTAPPACPLAGRFCHPEVFVPAQKHHL